MKLKQLSRNAGFSLVELLVALAIMAVLAVGAAVSYNLINRTNVKKAAEIVDDYIALCREKAKTSSAYEWNVTIDATGSKCVEVALVKITQQKDGVLNEEIIQSQELPSNVVITVKDQNKIQYNISSDAADNNYVSIAFAALNGNVSKVYFDKNSAVSLDTTTGYCDIAADYKGKKQKTVRLYFNTGKHSIID